MASSAEQYQRSLEEAKSAIIPYKLRRMFKMRDPYPVILARGWARDMAAVECILCVGCLIAIASLSFTTADSDDLLKDDDNMVVLGRDLTGGVVLNSRMRWATFALGPFLYKGALAFLEILAVACACVGACMATFCHFKFWKIEELGILKSLGYCTAVSATATCVSLALTAVSLLLKWRRALSNEIRGSLLVMSLYGIAAVVLLCLRVSTAHKAFRAATALREEIVVV
mmetsp:Transcript_26687/g.54650  ORF Transcript_26687/g.54650 Transcript_26687/m.54650 type:complete len:228 (-) Transcript_26687:284-967(-)